MKRTDKSVEKAVKEARYGGKNRIILDVVGQSEGIGYTESQLAFNSMLEFEIIFLYFQFGGLTTTDL
jgi:hypothetical protein